MTWLSVLYRIYPCLLGIVSKPFNHNSLCVILQLCTKPLEWRHNGRANVSNHRPHHCLLNPLFRRRSKKTSKLCVTGLCIGNSPGTGEFPAQMASNAEKCFHLMTSSCRYGIECINKKNVICAWINDWLNNREAGDLRRYHAHYVTVMFYRKFHKAVASQLSNKSYRMMANSLQACNCLSPNYWGFLS